MTGWDDWLYDVLPKVAISGKNVAIFCTGRMVVGLKGYPEVNLEMCCCHINVVTMPQKNPVSSVQKNFSDAVGELYKRFAERATNMFGFASTDGFNFTRSRAVCNGKFIVKLFDHKKQPELSKGCAVSSIVICSSTNDHK